MKKIALYLLISFLFITLSAFSVHKFYMAVYQINYSPEKKMLQITSRIFIDDLNNGIEKKYHQKTYLGYDNESAADINLLKKYLSENFTIKVNGQTKTMNLLSKEIDTDVLVCYMNCKEIKKINTLEIYNSVLTDWNSEQQNIVHVAVLGKKNSMLLTNSTNKEVLKY